MDDFFDKVKENAGKAKDGASRLTKQIVDKTSNVVSRTKLSFAVSETEGKINDIFEEIGKSVYESYKASGTVCENLEEKCKKVDELNEEVDELKEKLAQLKSSIRCECGEFNKKDAEFCSKCGKSLKREEEPEENADEPETIYAEVDANPPQTDTED